MKRIKGEQYDPNTKTWTNTKSILHYSYKSATKSQKMRSGQRRMHQTHIDRVKYYRHQRMTRNCYCKKHSGQESCLIVNTLMKFLDYCAVIATVINNIPQKLYFFLSIRN